MFFGVGISPVYADILRNYAGQAEKLTLVRVGSIHPSYQLLGLPITEFNEVFYYTSRPEVEVIYSSPAIIKDRYGNLRRFPNTEFPPSSARGVSKGDKYCWDDADVSANC